jgi:mono/diheme cytochrome c family protein
MMGFARAMSKHVPLAGMLLLLLVLSLAAASCGDDGAETETTALETTESVTETTAGTETTRDVTDTSAGEVDPAALYTDECAGCHGPAGEGGVGKQLSGRTDLTVEQAEVTIRQGAGGMPAFEGQLTDEQIEALAEYVVEELGQ